MTRVRGVAIVVVVVAATIQGDFVLDVPLQFPTSTNCVAHPRVWARVLSIVVRLSNRATLNPGKIREAIDLEEVLAEIKMVDWGD